MPVVITVMSYLFLNENVGLRRFLAVLVGFIGVLIIIQPLGEEFHWAMILSIFCASLGIDLFHSDTRYSWTRQQCHQPTMVQRIGYNNSYSLCNSGLAMA